MVHKYSVPAGINGLWCNGNTTVFGAVFLGSNPGSPTISTKSKVFHHFNWAKNNILNFKCYQSIMKKFLLVCLGFLVGLLAYALADHFGVTPTAHKQSVEQVDEPEAQEVETFTDVNDFLEFVGDIRNIHIVDSILITAPSEQIVNIAHVCIRKYGKIDRTIFYREYLQNDTYQYLPTQEQQQQYLQQDAPPANNQGGTQAATPPDTIVSASITKEGTTKVE